MQNRKGGEIERWTAAVALLIVVCVSEQAQAQVTAGEDKIITPLQITWEIFSGRPSPYFEITSLQELNEIQRRLSDLPLIVAGKEQPELFGDYIFELPDKQANRTRLITVYKSEIHVRTGSQKYSYSDSKSLRKYLDELRGRGKVISRDALPIP